MEMVVGWDGNGSPVIENHSLEDAMRQRKPLSREYVIQTCGQLGHDFGNAPQCKWCDAHRDPR